MSREDFDALKRYAREQHDKRVAKNPQRLEYAKRVLTENGITFKVCNEVTTQINCYFANGKVLTFYAGTGKIQGHSQLRGINSFVRLCKKQLTEGGKK
jgi:hypothetical protein